MEPNGVKLGIADFVGLIMVAVDVLDQVPGWQRTSQYQP
jgi:hypothetical protein